jgi:hypothetical protein
MPAHTRYGIFEALEDVWNRTSVGVLIEEFKATTANHGPPVRQTPDEGVDLFRRKLLAAILSRTAATGRHCVSRSEALGRDSEAIHDFEVPVHV